MEDSLSSFMTIPDDLDMILPPEISLTAFCADVPADVLRAFLMTAAPIVSENAAQLADFSSSFCSEINDSLTPPQFPTSASAALDSCDLVSQYLVDDVIPAPSRPSQLSMSDVSTSPSSSMADITEPELSPNNSCQHFHPNPPTNEAYPLVNSVHSGQPLNHFNAPSPVVSKCEAVRAVQSTKEPYVDAISSPVGLRGKSKMRKTKTYARAVASQFCHICSRRPRRGHRVLTCRRLQQGMCRKIVCERCAVEEGWSLDNASSSDLQSQDWLCPHCTGECPPRSQCHVYNRVNARRKSSSTANESQSTVPPPSTMNIESRVDSTVADLQPVPAPLPLGVDFPMEPCDQVQSVQPEYLLEPPSNFRLSFPNTYSQSLQPQQF